MSVRAERVAAGLRRTAAAGFRGRDNSRWRLFICAGRVAAGWRRFAAAGLRGRENSRRSLLVSAGRVAADIGGR